VSCVGLEEGSDLPADVELMRLAFPGRVFTLNQVEYAIDRLPSLYRNRELAGVQSGKRNRKFFGFAGR
jgi:tyrosine phenol-lyase